MAYVRKKVYRPAVGGAGGERPHLTAIAPLHENPGEVQPQLAIVALQPEEPEGEQPYPVQGETPRRRRPAVGEARKNAAPGGARPRLAAVRPYLAKESGGRAATSLRQVVIVPLLEEPGESCRVLPLASGALPLPPRRRRNSERAATRPRTRTSYFFS